MLGTGGLTMAEELLQFLIFVNVFVLGVLFYGWVKLGQEVDKANEIFEQYSKLVIGGRKEFWKSLGAYETENGRMYLDLDGIRLVIANGKIEGWYMA